MTIQNSFIMSTHAADMNSASQSQQLRQIFFLKEKNPPLDQSVKSRLIRDNYHGTNIAS